MGPGEQFKTTRFGQICTAVRTQGNDSPGDYRILVTKAICERGSKQKTLQQHADCRRPSAVQLTNRSQDIFPLFVSCVASVEATRVACSEFLAAILCVLPCGREPRLFRSYLTLQRKYNRSRHAQN